MLVNLAYKFAR